MIWMPDRMVTCRLFPTQSCRSIPPASAVVGLVPLPSTGPSKMRSGTRQINPLLVCVNRYWKIIVMADQRSRALVASYSRKGTQVNGPIKLRLFVTIKSELALCCQYASISPLERMVNSSSKETSTTLTSRIPGFC